MGAIGNLGTLINPTAPVSGTNLGTYGSDVGGTVGGVNDGFDGSFPGGYLSQVSPGLGAGVGEPITGISKNTDGSPSPDDNGPDLIAKMKHMNRWADLKDAIKSAGEDEIAAREED